MTRSAPGGGPAAAELAVGDQVDVTIGPIAHGGHCVARVGDDPSGRVLFVRHALPGERVRVRITELHPSYLRADAVQVSRSAADRVTPPCPHAGPGRCGGCDFQHVSGTGQRWLKAQVIRDQFTRLARLDVAPMLQEVEELPGGLLGWRTRTSYAVDRTGRPGLRQHRSHRVEVLTACPLGAPGVGDHPLLHRTWPGFREIEVVRGDDDPPVVRGHRSGAAPARRGRRRENVDRLDGPARVRHHVAGRTFDTAPGTFWQVHPAAASALAEAVRSGLGLGPGEVAFDLYAGAGLFSAVLADAVGPTGRVVAVEGSSSAANDAAANLAAWPWVEVHAGPVSAQTVTRLVQTAGRPDVVVFDPPRAGAGPDVMRAVLRAGPRAVGYVSCDPATLARDVRAALDVGWRLAGLRAFDAFPMTHHVECVAILTESSVTT